MSVLKSKREYERNRLAKIERNKRNRKYKKRVLRDNPNPDAWRYWGRRAQ